MPVRRRDYEWAEGVLASTPRVPDVLLTKAPSVEKMSSGAEGCSWMETV